MKISELTNKGTLDVLLLGVEEKVARNNSSYVVFQVTDGVETIFVQQWNSVAEPYKKEIGCVVSMTIKCGTYNGKKTYESLMIEVTDKPTDAFIRKVPVDIMDMWTEIIERCNNMRKDIQPIVLQILMTNKEKLLYWAAAKQMHHALYGGLLYHMYRMGNAADAVCNTYVNLDRDLLVAGAYLHDIGKLRELNTDRLGTAEYTIPGTLLGHMVLGIKMLDEVKGDQNIIFQLEHMIASHHGEPECGAIVRPATAEAMMLHELDMMDSKIYQFEEVYEKMESGTLSEKIFGLNTSVFKN